MRIPAIALARLDDLVLDHAISHLLVHKNSLTNRKTQASIRCVLLLGVSCTHIFKHAFIGRMKACGDVPCPTAHLSQLLRKNLN
jgi:hypothetical protein